MTGHSLKALQEAADKGWADIAAGHCTDVADHQLEDLIGQLLGRPPAGDTHGRLTARRHGAGTPPEAPRRPGNSPARILAPAQRDTTPLVDVAGRPWSYTTGIAVTAGLPVWQTGGDVMRFVD